MKHLIIAFLLLTSISVKSQISTDYKISEKQKATALTLIQSSAITSDGERIITIKNITKKSVGKSKQQIELFDQDLNILHQKIITEVNILEIIQLSDKIYFLFYDNNGGLYMSLIDQTNLENLGTPIKLRQLKIRKLRGFQDSFDIPAIRVSENKTKFALLDTYSERKNDIVKHKYQVFDEDVEPIWQNTFYSDKNRFKTTTILGNNGTIYVARRVLTKERFSTNRYDKVVIKALHDTNEKEAILEFKNGYKYFNNLRLENTGDDDGLILYSFIKGEKGILSNFSITEYDKDLNEVSNTINDLTNINFSTNEIDEGSSKKEKKKIEADKQNLRIIDIETLSNNKKVVIAEQQRWRSYYNTIGTGLTTQSSIYYHEDVFCFLFDENDKLEWVKKIPKYQISQTSLGFLGISTKIDDDFAYIMYNDNEYNLKSTTDAIPYRGSLQNGIFKIVQIDLSNGALKSDVVFTLKESEIRIEPTIDFELTDGSIIFMGFKGKKRSVVKVSLP